MSQTATITKGTLPVGFCPATYQAMYDKFMDITTVVFNGTFSTYVMGSTVPTVDQQIYPWLRTGDATLNGWYIYSGGAWVRATAHPQRPGFVQDDYTSYANEATAKAAIELYDMYDAGTPFWRLADGTNGTPDLRGRSTMGAGAGTALTARTFGTSLGEENHILTTAEMPSHTHAIHCYNWSTTYVGGAPTLPLADFSFNEGTLEQVTNSAGSDTPHNTIHPVTCMWKIIRTSRIY